MRKCIHKFRWWFVLLAIMLVLFGLGKLAVISIEKQVARCVSDFQIFEPSPRTAVMFLYGRLYFPTYELFTEAFTGDEHSIGFTVKNGKLFWACFEKKSNNLSRRFAVYQSDLHGKHASEVFSMEGEFYNCSYTDGTRDAFFFSYYKEKNKEETLQILKYDINSNSITVVSTGNELFLWQAVAQQEQTECERDRWEVEQNEDSFKILHREDGATVATVSCNFWEGSIYEEAFADKPVWKVTTDTWNDTVIFSAWIAYGFLQSYVTVSFAYDPLTGQLDFLSCVEPYEYEWFDIILVE